MSEGPIRKACDRCHRQKLSCKRVGDEPCERCVRLKKHCTSSPSLRYRKQHPQTSRGDVGRKGAPSPKRQRTESGSQVVQPDMSVVKVQAEEAANGSTVFEDNAVVSPDTMLDMVDFDFGFGHSSLYQPNPSLPNGQQQPQAFSGTIEDLMSPHGDAISSSWSPVHSATSGSAFTSPVVPQADQTGRMFFGTHEMERQPLGLRTPKRRVRQRTRQIMLRPCAGGQDSTAEDWLPRITEINSRLFELSSVLPLHADSPEDPGRSSAASTVDGGSLTVTPFPMDEMFRLSRYFAESLTEKSPIEVASPASDEGNSHPARGLDSLSDPATCLFVLSTYVRLLDMYQKVFSCIHSELAHIESGSLFQSWKLPGVSIGSFAVDSTPSLQMSLTIQLAEEFLLQMRRATSSLDSNLRSGGSPAAKASDTTSMFSGVVDVSFQALKRQEESLGKELKDLRKDMEIILDG
ncbi:hypothetical protein CCHL11_08558 [Colletotrichum chlorophyti]|uniref:Zn(2)-C6 fungal-type domain-containing protein n=1 Tax=Colletotrichum chlorophyti TaxID=708187 RepID=A0A1Q8RAI4_9PEZI|nr:hypothetical protein CCHL11_08558 [Colletotrichum chlorophyti]